MDLVADMLVQGATAAEILEGYPTLSQEMISLAPLWISLFRSQQSVSRTLTRGKTVDSRPLRPSRPIRKS